ncbi:hypothetical protein MMC11_004103 [Xylographa trunciseda]|nr:hypothetical protein [Xylographa trunciseda]
MSLWQSVILIYPVKQPSYTALTPRTRLLVGLGIITWGGLGLLVTDQAEKKFNMVPTERDREKLEEVMPRITIVEREERS